MTVANRSPTLTPFPAPAGRGVFEPFSRREKGGDEGKGVRRFHSVRQPAKGFTLIEVLVALAVLTVALSAVMHALGKAIDLTDDLRDRNVALWIAQNRLLTHQLQRAWPSPDTTEGKAEMAGRAWRWREQVATTPEPALRRIEIEVRAADREGLRARLIGFLQQP